MAAEHNRTSRGFAFEPTPAVAASRARQLYVDCPVCGSDRSEQILHRHGVRLVRCLACDTTFANPVSTALSEVHASPHRPSTKDWPSESVVLVPGDSLHERMRGAKAVVLGRLLEIAAPRDIIDTLIATTSVEWVAVEHLDINDTPTRDWQIPDAIRVVYTTARLEALFARGGFSLVDSTSEGGLRTSVFRRAPPRSEKLSIVFPVFNEERFVADVIDALLAKKLPIERELIIVESNSTDGTRAIVERYAGRPGVKLVYEDRPQGKGHAVKTGLAAVTGSIILIQDADFEYDIADYDALLAPILQRKATFVLGSRSLGIDDWRVRRFEGNAAKRLALNTAHIAFAKTFNLLYGHHTTDINTMFKVFRTECLDGIELDNDRFALDIELVCRLARRGHVPLEVPVNYVARGFVDGKKISFVRDAIPSYLALFRYRFGR